MANILDIFRTQTGKKLLEKSRDVTGLEIETLQHTFVYILPALLTLYRKKGISDNDKPKHLIAFIENGKLSNFGKQETEYLLTSSEKKIILDFSEILDIKKEDFETILHISVGITAIIISEIKEKTNAELEDILKTLCGTDIKHDQDFVKVLMKNSNDANIIESGEEIALGKKNDDDPSLLGGYVGGR